jgi:hypothetical protein
MMASPVLLIACVPLVTNWSASSRRNDVTTTAFAHDLLNSVEPYGILVTVGDNDTFPLWYAQEVEGIRQDVVIANTSLLNTDWYTRQLIRNPVREYDAAKGPEIYRGGSWIKPGGAPVNMTLEQADSIPLAYQLPDTVVFEAGNIRARIEPRVLTRADIFVLQMIKDNPGRPVYFSRTAGSYGRELGLDAYLLTQGLARRLLDHIPSIGRDTLLVPGEGFVDVRRTTALWIVFQDRRRSSEGRLGRQAVGRNSRALCEHGIHDLRHAAKHRQRCGRQGRARRCEADRAGDAHRRFLQLRRGRAQSDGYPG